MFHRSSPPKVLRPPKVAMPTVLSVSQWGPVCLVHSHLYLKHSRSQVALLPWKIQGLNLLSIKQSQIDQFTQCSVESFHTGVWLSLKCLVLLVQWGLSILEPKCTVTQWHSPWPSVRVSFNTNKQTNKQTNNGNRPGFTKRPPKESVSGKLAMRILSWIKPTTE